MERGELLQSIIEEKGYNLMSLSKASGVPYTTIRSMIERNLNNASIDNTMKICKTLGISVDSLVSSSKKVSEQTDSTSQYTYIPTSISAGTPIVAEPVADYETEKITLPDSVMGKWAGHKDIFIMRVNGESMNKVMPHGSLIAVKEVEISQLKNGDIVVYSDSHDYAVKRFYMYDDELIFRPDSTDLRFSEMRIKIDNAENVRIHGKVVLYIVELD